MVVINNHEDDGHSSSSSTCLPDGFQGNDVEETGFADIEEAQEIDFSTVPPTQNVSCLLLSPCQGTRYPLGSTPERLNKRGTVAVATTLTRLSQGRGAEAARVGAAMAQGRGQSAAMTRNSTILPRGVGLRGIAAAATATGGTTTAAAVVGVVGTAAAMVGRGRGAGTATGTLACGAGAVATTMARGRGGSGTAPPNLCGGIKNYSEFEISSLLQCIRRVVPIGNDQWELVAELHRMQFSKFSRTADSIKRKFSSLANQQPGTGDQSIPPLVKLAKEIREVINVKAGVSDADVSDFFVDEEVEDPVELAAVEVQLQEQPSREVASPPQLAAVASTLPSGPPSIILTT